MPVGNTYSPDEIYATLIAVARSHGKNEQRGATIGTAIVLRESGGNARAYRDHTKNPGGGDDRGWWQFNTKYFPDVTDAVAYDPKAATERAWQESDGFQSWGPWKGKPLTDETLTPAIAAAARVEHVSVDDVTKLVHITDTLGGSVANTVPGAVDKVVDTVLPWADALGKLLSVLTSASFWIRLGTGALGVALVVFGLASFGINPTIRIRNVTR